MKQTKQVELPREAFTTEQAYTKYLNFLEIIKNKGEEMNSPCKKCNKLGKPCSSEHDGKILKQVELPEEYTDKRLEAVIDTHTIPQFRLFLEDVYNRGRNDAQTPYKPDKPEWELTIDDWNWSKGGSLGIIKSNEDLLSLKELVSELITQAQQEARKEITDFYEEHASPGATQEAVERERERSVDVVKKEIDRQSGLRAGCPYCGMDLCDCESGRKTALRIIIALQKEQEQS